MADHAEDQLEPEVEDEQEPELEAVENRSEEIDPIEEDEEDLSGRINVGSPDHPVGDDDEEEECRSSATPTQDDNASPIEGQPASLSHQPRLTDGLVSTLAVEMEEIPLPVVVDDIQLPVVLEDIQLPADVDDIPLPIGASLLVDVSDGDLDDDGGGDNDLGNLVMFKTVESKLK